MPMHDWTRVDMGIFHSAALSWVAHLKEALNLGGLPADHYALSECEQEVRQSEGSPGGEDAPVSDDSPESDAESDVWFYAQRRRTIVIRHESGDRVVALIEIVSPANKHSAQTVDALLCKIEAALRDRIHVLLVDPLPPSAHDPGGMHGAVWERFAGGSYEAPEWGRPTQSSYRATESVRAYVEPFRVGASMAEMPLFLDKDQHVPVPLEETYMRAWKGVPQRWKSVIEGEV